MAYSVLLYYGTLCKCGVIHAMMREVADHESGNFRGVCPILNRAKVMEVLRDLAAFKHSGRAICCPELSETPAMPVL